MATRKGRTVLKFTDDDFQLKRKFPVVPSGTYFIKGRKDSSIKQGDAGKYIDSRWDIVKGPHKGKTSLFCVLSEATTWRIGQLLTAAQVSSTKGKKMTLEDVLALIQKGLLLRAAVGIEPARDQWPKRNKVNQFLPLKVTADDDDEEDEDDLDEDDEDLDEDEDEEDDEEDEDDDEDEDEEEDEDDEDDEDEDEDEDEDDEDQEEEAPRRGGRKGRAAPAKPAPSKRGGSKKGGRR